MQKGALYVPLFPNKSTSYLFSTGNYVFPSGHHYNALIKESSNVTDASRARRLAQEAVTLSNSLPLSLSSTVFVR